MEFQDLIEEQLNYYRAVAQEYDQWFLRRGRYDRGPEHRTEWFREIATLERALEPVIEGKEVLELACGTGLWTHRLAARSSRVLATDAAPEMLSINRERLRTGNVEYCKADIFSWTPPTGFDLVFVSFWLSYVPVGRFDEFWDNMRRALKPEGSVFLVDSLLEPTSTARDDHSVDRSGVVRRKLNDGREFQIVKVFYEPSELESRLAALGWSGWLHSTGKFFLYGLVERTDGNERKPASR